MKRRLTLGLLAAMLASSAILYAQNYISTTGPGTTTTSQPFLATQTWNDGAVTFEGLKVAFTETASAAASRYLAVYGGAAGTTLEFSVGKGGTSSQLLGHTIAATTNQLVLGVTNTTTLSAVAPASSIVLTLPTAAGGVATQLYCGDTGVGNQTCTATAVAATTKVYAGHSTLSSNAAVITFPVAFASTTYDCVANDITTRANPVQMLSTSNSTATITNTTGASDVVNWICVGQ